MSITDLGVSHRNYWFSGWGLGIFLGDFFVFEWLALALSSCEAACSPGPPTLSSLCWRVVSFGISLLLGFQLGSLLRPDNLWVPPFPYLSKQWLYSLPGKFIVKTNRIMLVNPLTGWHTAGTLLHKAWLCPSQGPHPSGTFVSSFCPREPSHLWGTSRGHWCLFSFVMGHGDLILGTSSFYRWGSWGCEAQT